MNLIEQLNDLCTEYEGGALALSVVTDLRAIIEQAKREAVETVAVPSSVMRDALMRSVDVVAPTPQPELARCKSCNGNDYDMPCAYPSEGKHGCLRDARLSPQPDHTKLIGELATALHWAIENIDQRLLSNDMAKYEAMLKAKRTRDLAREAIK